MSADQARASSNLTRETIVGGLSALSDRLGQNGVVGELCRFGGATMVLAFTARLSTKDVDAVFRPAQAVRHFALQVAQELGLPDDWLNDGVKGFVSSRHETTVGDLPQFEHLRLTMPVPQYLLAMKCMAARVGGTEGVASDVADIVFLTRHLQLPSAQEVLDVVGNYYPANRIPGKTRYFVEGLFDEGQV